MAVNNFWSEFSKDLSLVMDVMFAMQIVVWDALTAEKVARWPSNHMGNPRWLEHSPVEAAFVTSGTDRSIRFWKET